MTDIDKRLDKIFDKNIKTYASIDTKTGRPLEVTIKGLEEAKQELKQLINEVRIDEAKWYQSRAMNVDGVDEPVIFADVADLRLNQLTKGE